jgi:hypothetical protein
MGGHVKRNFSTLDGRVTATGSGSGNVPPAWPTRHGSTSKTSKTTNMNLVDKQTLMVPDFVLKPQAVLQSSKYGYQEVHAIYNDMRSFFAKRATSKYQNEVATIKVTLMSMKPNNRNPQMVMVRK